MEYLVIKNRNNGSENITSRTLQKLYDLAIQTNDTLLFAGNVVVPHVKQSVLNYFENGFPDFNITVTGQKYIDFADPVVEEIVAKSYDPDGVGITQNDLNSINWMTTAMQYNTNITTFNELSLFINIKEIAKESFLQCTSLELIGLSNITTIKDYAFDNCSSLQSLDAPNLTTTGIAAFRDCSSFTSVSIPNIQTLGWWCFQRCGSIQSVDIGQHLTIIPEGAFSNCTHLASIDLSRITDFGHSAFLNDTSLTSVDLSSAVNIRGGSGSMNGAFAGCTNLETIIGGSNIDTLNENAFANCTKLSAINLSNVSTISSYAFTACTSLSSIGSLLNVKSIGNLVFDRCTNLNIELNTPNLTTLGLGAFRLSGIRKILSLGKISTIKSGSYLWYWAFGGCLNLSYVDLSTTNSLTEIEGSAFYNCPNLTTIILPNSLSLIGAEAFNLSVVQHLILLSSTPPTLENASTMYSNNTVNATIYVPNQTARSAYLADSLWQQIPGISSRIKLLSELPSGVWTTGAYDLY